MDNSGPALVDERSFTDGFLALCTDLELVALQHDLRQHAEDKPYLDQVLRELGKRQAQKEKGGSG